MIVDSGSVRFTEEFDATAIPFELSGDAQNKTGQHQVYTQQHLVLSGGCHHDLEHRCVSITLLFVMGKWANA